MTELNILFHGDVQLMDYGESRTGGPWVKIRLPDPDDLGVFRGLDPGEMKKAQHVLHCTIADGDIAQLAQGQEKPKKGEHGKFWRDLMASGFFRAPAVLRCIGPEEEFEAWIRNQPSVLDGAQDWDSEKGEPRNECAHIRRVSEGAGTSERPPYFAVPMTHAQHSAQHQEGYAAALRQFRPKDASVDALEWFTRKADQHRTDWASLLLSHKLMAGVNSRSEVPPELVREWVGENSLDQYLPARLNGDSK